MPNVLELQEVDIKPDFEGCVTLKEASILDERERVVSVTLISVGPGNRRDKNFYSKEAIESGPALFNGKKCYANHPSALDAKIQPERRVQEIIGYFSEVKVEGEALKAKLHIIPGENAEWAWPLIKESIAYSKKFPGQNLSGLSINARGGQEPMDYQGEKWKKVTQFLEVRSVDLVTEPARGGKVEQVLSESEGTPQNVADILNAAKLKVRELNDEKYPGMEDLRRMLDQLGTSLQVNQTEGEPMADNKDEKKDKDLDFAKMSESFKKMAEGEKDSEKKEAYMAASDHFKKQGEKCEADKKEAEAKREADAKKEADIKKEADKVKTESEKKDEKITELQAQLVETKMDQFISDAGLSEAQSAFVSNLLEGVTDLEKIEKTIKDYAAVTLKESTQRRPHNFPKSHGAVKTDSKSFSDNLSAAIA